MQLPFFGNSEVPAARETPLDFSDDDMNGGSSASESARRLIRGLLTVDALKRVRSLRTLKNHAFYHHFDFESLRSKKVYARLNSPVLLFDNYRCRGNGIALCRCTFLKPEFFSM